MNNRKTIKLVQKILVLFFLSFIHLQAALQPPHGLRRTVSFDPMLKADAPPPQEPSKLELFQKELNAFLAEFYENPKSEEELTQQAIIILLRQKIKDIYQFSQEHDLNLERINLDFKKYALLMAAFRGYNDVARYLVQVQKADPNVATDMHMTVLMIASLHGHPGIVAFLTTLPANHFNALNWINSDRLTALDLAKQENRNEQDPAMQAKYVQIIGILRAAGAEESSSCTHNDCCLLL